MKKDYKKGQSLWEVILALAIAALVALGLVRSTTTSVKTSRYSASESEATALAQKKISEIKTDINGDYYDFWDDVSITLDGEEVPGRSPADDNSVSPYCINSQVIRSSSSLPTKAPADNSGQMVTISITVFWDEAGSGTDCNNHSYGSHVQVQTYVTN